MKSRMFLGTTLSCIAMALTATAHADPSQVRREWREGARNVAAEQREAAREIRHCRTQKCVLREVREGQREVERERRETWREVARERAEDARYRHVGYYDRYGRYRYVDVAQLRDPWYRGDGRWYRDGRYWNPDEYVTRYYAAGNSSHDDDDDLVKGILIGAAAVGVIAAIHEANDGD